MIFFELRQLVYQPEQGVGKNPQNIWLGKKNRLVVELKIGALLQINF